MMRIFVAAILIFASTIAAAQQQPPDPVFMQRAMSVLEGQRNQAMNATVIAEARAAGLADELSKAQARIKELEPKPEPEK